nr:aminotransferase class IV family protein [uncultured Ruegeria sp.]
MESPLCPPAETDFRLIETLAYRPGQGMIRLDLHLTRMHRTANALHLPFSPDDAQSALQTITGDTPLRCRLTMDVSGRFEVTTGVLADNPAVWRIAVAETRLSSSDIWLRHKTTQRETYDTARASLPAGTDELIFLNELDELCEGTITNLFIETSRGQHLTPALTCGLLPGILRQQLLETGKTTQAVLTLADLRNARNLWVGNSLRGLIPAELVLH